MDRIVSGALGLGVGASLVAASSFLTRTWVLYTQEEWEVGLSGRAARVLRSAVIVGGLALIGLGVRVMVWP